MENKVHPARTKRISSWIMLIVCIDSLIILNEHLWKTRSFNSLLDWTAPRRKYVNVFFYHPTVGNIHEREERIFTLRCSEDVRLCRPPFIKVHQWTGRKRLNKIHQEKRLFSLKKTFQRGLSQSCIWTNLEQTLNRWKTFGKFQLRHLTPTVELFCF